MTRSELIQNLSTKFNSVPKKVVKEMVETVFEEIGNALADGKPVQLRNHLHLSVNKNKSVERRNPRTGETFILENRNRVIFKPGLAMKEAVKMYKGETD